MRIAVTFENDLVFQHFGHTEHFKFYDVEDGKIIEQKIVCTNGQGHGALADFLKSNNVDSLICGGIGSGAQTALSSANIKFFGGVTGKADDAAQALITGTLVFNPNVKCDHHDNEHENSEHTCGSHGCGNHNETKYTLVK